MAYVLIILMFATAIGVAHLLALVSKQLVSVLIAKVVEDEALCASWLKYIRLAVYIVAIAGGIEVYRVERAFSTFNVGVGQIAIELFRVARDASIAVIWLLLPVFLTSLVIMELRKTFGRRDEQSEDEAAE